MRYKGPSNASIHEDEPFVLCHSVAHIFESLAVRADIVATVLMPHYPDIGCGRNEKVEVGIVAVEDEHEVSRVVQAMLNEELGVAACIFGFMVGV